MSASRWLLIRKLISLAFLVDARAQARVGPGPVTPLDYITVVLRLMAEETSLEEVVRRMESFTKEIQTRKSLKKDERG